MNEQEFKKYVCKAFEEDSLLETAPEAESYDYEFSKDFNDVMKKAERTSGHTYVSIGRRRVRMALVAALIATLLLASAVGAVAIRRPITTWLMKNNEKQGTADINFDVKDENNLREEFRYIKPTVPEEYKIVREEKLGEFDQYDIEYHNDEGKIIVYAQMGHIENMGMSIDNEDNNFHKVKINGFEGYATSKKGNNSLYWSDGFYFYILTGTCDMKVLEDISKSIY